MANVYAIYLDIVSHNLLEKHRGDCAMDALCYRYNLNIEDATRLCFMIQDKSGDGTAELVIRSTEKVIGITRGEVWNILKHEALDTFMYYQDASDNMDGWEDHELPTFFRVFFDMALYFKNRA
jgi:hypothetical protein